MEFESEKITNIKIKITEEDLKDMLKSVASCYKHETDEMKFFFEVSLEGHLKTILLDKGFE